jgi:uncharacterized protein
MAFAPVTLISLLFHGLIAWRLLPDLPAVAALVLGGMLLASALLVPQGLLGRKSKKSHWRHAVV